MHNSVLKLQAFFLFSFIEWNEMRFVGDQRLKMFEWLFQEIIISIYNIETIVLSNNSLNGYSPLPLSSVFITS